MNTRYTPILFLMMVAFLISALPRAAFAEVEARWNPKAITFFCYNRHKTSMLRQEKCIKHYSELMGEEATPAEFVEFMGYLDPHKIAPQAAAEAEVLERMEKNDSIEITEEGAKILCANRHAKEPERAEKCFEHYKERIGEAATVEEVLEFRHYTEGIPAPKESASESMGRQLTGKEPKWSKDGVDFVCKNRHAKEPERLEKCMSFFNEHVGDVIPPDVAIEMQGYLSNATASPKVLALPAVKATRAQSDDDEAEALLIVNQERSARLPDRYKMNEIPQTHGR